MPRGVDAAAHGRVTVSTSRGCVVEINRRGLLTVLALGTAAALAGCTRPDEARGALAIGPVPQPAPAPHPVRAQRVRPHATPSPPPTTAEAVVTTPVLSDPSPVPGLPEIVRSVPTDLAPSAIALTIDDGFNPEVVAAYVEFAQTTGVHLTFNPNGLYGYAWEPHAEVLRPLVASGQIQIGNHTFHHPDMRKLSRHRMTEELERNEEWIQTTFGTTSRPWFRPPFGFRDARTDAHAGELGWTKIALWNGSFGDATVLTPEVLLQQAQTYLQPGVLMLGHANHPTVTHLYPQLLELIGTRGLSPLTLDEAFGTSRAVG